MSTVLEMYQIQLKQLREKVAQLEAEKAETENDIRTIVGSVKDIFSTLNLTTDSFQGGNMMLVMSKIIPKVSKKENINFIMQKWEGAKPTLSKYEYLLKENENV